MQLASYPREVWIVFLVSIIISLGLSFRSNVFKLVLCVLLGSVISFMRIEQTTHEIRYNSVEAFVSEEEIILHGIILAEPDKRPMKTKFTVDVDNIVINNGALLERVMLPLDDCHWQSLEESTTSREAVKCFKVDGKVLVTDNDQWPVHKYGDEVVAIGVLELPGQIEDFHYDRYLSRFDIYSVMYRAKIETISEGHGNKIFAFLYDLKEKFESQINRLYPEPHASFMAGLLTGSRRGIPEHLLEDFQTTGLTHIIAISGYNITIVMSVVAACLFFLPLRWRFYPSIISIIFFTIFVGASPSVVRAAIMGSLGLFALQSGRMKHSFIAVLLTAFIMIAVNPKYLWYDAGFQLSFLAVLGVTFIGPMVEPYIKAVPKSFSLREALQMTIAAQLTAVPLIVVLFGHFSVVAPLANVLVAFFIPLGMLFGFLGTVLSFISFGLGQAVSFLGWGMLQIIIFVAESLSNVPYALLDVEVSWWGILIYYIVLTALIIFWSRKKVE
ncbi:DUF4131 domain-containing protein [Candidatus Peribacteria bacterium]|nr:DUF4131 domain-containing protein [Candidatus Peribacteria bacterium]MBT4020958.1 DUF4131 domain-containing protein [Candidatus Peribacteria bacterium]MBT4474094.1 DUF4131 domain-containing protein [Candidatus Peribacteria bacterium]